ncbi:selenocysteine-specific translation elongation factor [Aquifex aeolicus]|uniref:Selenocysteine-specific elongation factor n=1 Tax=Aquifex aeolicus (strain VF5) TaxID=224324 RepID=O67141_AQUAE|nr:selenocysteine-specific translation elongation factor [Aquifex aeolicus]AAC07099.1 elongation factor SelB [Aquifex aeolicus VF5]
MKYILFATAGHVDHGKTTLIKTLTGIDTDRLPEEKKRGLSIDIGFAYIDFPDINTRLEIIDVPGHERFIKNAIAGICSASGLILVVDPNEGIMPQTIEHLRVAKSFGIKHGIAVLTKMDKVDEELAHIAEEELIAFLEKEEMNMEIVKVSAVTGQGIEDLKNSIKKLLESINNLNKHKPLRIFVDSAFVVKGYGTVLRGSCFEGEVKEGDKVVVEPIGVISRVRKMQNHGVFVKKAVAGERIALNLPEVDAKKVKRGFLILKPESYEKSNVLIVKTEIDLKPGKIYQVFFGMRETVGKISVIDKGIYLVRLKENAIVRRGDKLVVLDSSGNFLGGAEVLHPKVRVTKKAFIKKNIKDLLENFECYLLKERGPIGLKLEFFKRITGVSPKVANLKPESIEIRGVYYLKGFIENLKLKIKKFLDTELQNAFGVDKEKVKSMFSLNEELLKYILDELKTYKIVNELIIDERKSDLEKNEDFQKLMSILKGGIKEEREIILEGIPKEILTLSIKRKYAHRIGEYLIISDELLKKYINELKELGKTFNVQQAKNKLGLTRKYLIPLLEYLDYLGLTVREGNERRWKR